jgi:hypothetical protein
LGSANLKPDSQKVNTSHKYDMNFREFFELQDAPAQDALWLYFHNPNLSVRQIAAATGKSVAEVYRKVHSVGQPNRKHTTNHHNVLAFSDSGLSIQKIAELTGYTPRNVRYILKNHLNERT